MRFPRTHSGPHEIIMFGKYNRLDFHLLLASDASLPRGSAKQEGDRFSPTYTTEDQGEMMQDGFEIHSQ